VEGYANTLFKRETTHFNMVTGVAFELVDIETLVQLKKLNPCFKKIN
jgi:hypothetical protein